MISQRKGITHGSVAIVGCTLWVYYSTLEAVIVQRTLGIDPGQLYRHLGSGSVVIVREVGKDGGVLWDSFTDFDLIEGHTWGKMMGTSFVQQFRLLQGSNEELFDTRFSISSKHSTKPN